MCILEYCTLTPGWIVCIFDLILCVHLYLIPLRKGGRKAIDAQNQLKLNILDWGLDMLDRWIVLKLDIFPRFQRAVIVKPELQIAQV